MKPGAWFKEHAWYEFDPSISKTHPHVCQVRYSGKGAPDREPAYCFRTEAEAKRYVKNLDGKQSRITSSFRRIETPNGPQFEICGYFPAEMLREMMKK